MRRLAVFGVAVWLSGCVAINPDWDDPAASATAGTTIAVQATDEGTPTDGSSSASSGATTGASSSDDAASNAATGSTADATTESSSDATSIGEPPCDDGWARCDGVCEDIDEDPRHCGATCVDCRIEFGPGAECKHGACGEGGGGEGKGG